MTDNSGVFSVNNVLIESLCNSKTTLILIFLKIC